MLAHSHNLRHDSLISPLDAEHLGQLLQVLCRRLADAEDGIAKPAHAQAAELLVKELDAQLRCQQRDILDDGQPDAPLLVLGERDDGGEKGL